MDMLLVLAVTVFQDAPRAREIDAWVAKLADADATERLKAQEQLRGLAKDITYALAALEKAGSAKEAAVAARAQQARELLRCDLPRGEAASLGSDNPLDNDLMTEMRARRDVLDGQGKGRDVIDEYGAIVTLLEEQVKKGEADAERTYQKGLRQYEALRETFIAGDPKWINQWDAWKEQIERAYGGSERLVKRARMIAGGVDDAVRAGDRAAATPLMTALRELRFRREFFQDERGMEMDRIFKEVSTRCAR